MENPFSRREMPIFVIFKITKTLFTTDLLWFPW